MVQSEPDLSSEHSEIESRPRIMQVEQQVSRLTALNSIEARKTEEVVRRLLERNQEAICISRSLIQNMSEQAE